MAALLLFAAGCASAPYTHRTQFIVVPESEELTLGADYRTDPNLKVTALPSTAELEAGSGSPDAALRRYARSFNDKTSDRRSAQIMIEAMSTVYEVSAAELTRRLKGPDLSFGEVAVASALAKAGAGSFDQVAAGHKAAEVWATRDASVAKQALSLLREVQIEARRLAGKYGAH